MVITLNNKNDWKPSFLKPAAFSASRPADVVKDCCTPAPNRKRVTTSVPGQTSNDPRRRKTREAQMRAGLPAVMAIRPTALAFKGVDKPVGMPVDAEMRTSMIRASLAKGTPEESIAAVLNVNVHRIREKAHLLDNIAPEVVSLLKDRHVIGQVFSILKKMKPFRQIEAAEMMIAANRYTATYASMILMTTRPEALAASEAKKKLEPEVSLENIARMEREMERLHQDYQAVEDGMGDAMLSLVVAKGYIARLLRNENIHKYLTRHHEDLLGSLVTTMDAIAADNRTPELE